MIVWTKVKDELPEISDRHIVFLLNSMRPLLGGYNIEMIPAKEDELDYDILTVECFHWHGGENDAYFPKENNFLGGFTAGGRKDAYQVTHWAYLDLPKWVYPPK